MSNIFHEYRRNREPKKKTLRIFCTIFEYLFENKLHDLMYKKNVLKKFAATCYRTFSEMTCFSKLWNMKKHEKVRQRHCIEKLQEKNLFCKKN